MNKDIFNIETFNIVSDEKNYYFFRALNMGDIDDIKNGIIANTNTIISRIRTDRERYEKDPKYTENDNLTLEEIFDHIKMHHRKDTNCISLTSNANVAAMYGRGYYEDKYVMVKIPKRDIGSYVVNAGSYILEEIEKRIEEFIKNGELDDLSKYYMDLIDNTRSQEDLDNIFNRIKKEKEELDDFEKGIVYDFNKTTSIDYSSLNEKQNFEKNKIIAKIDLLSKNIIKNVSNKFLIQTIGNAFSSLELTHYKDIPSEKIIQISPEMIDLFSVLQQIPDNYSYINELKFELLNYCKNNNEIMNFEYKDFDIDIENDYTIEKMYNLTEGNVDFYSSIELYKKSFYLSKSKARTISVVKLLNEITNNNPKYNELIHYILENTYGVEPEIFSRLSKNKLQISESVNLEFKPKEEELFRFINGLSENDLKYIINNPLKSLNYYLKNFKSVEYDNVDKETYYANAIIDLFDWKKLGIVSFSIKQRNDIVNKLKENNVLRVYDYLKSKGIKEQSIVSVLLTTIIKEKELNKLDLNDTFTIEELEHFLGYYKIKDTDGLKLRSYQATAVKNINKCFSEHQFCATVLPTGAGKSFVALAEMLKYKDKEILYLAPSDEILNQIENYIVKYIYGETLTKTNKEILKEVFPNLKLRTYSSLLTESGAEIINHKYDLIIFDELHRTGAMEWGKKIDELLSNQDDQTKVLGITATPQRDVDYKNMADEWARYFGYTEEEIQKHKHLAYNMDLNEAIELGYVVNPRVVNCEYTLEQDGSLENLQNNTSLIEDEEKKNEIIKKHDILRRKVGQADGVEKVIGDNIKNNGRYIVFCPVYNKNNRIVEDVDGNIMDTRVSGVEVLKKYQNELTTCLKKYYNVDDEKINSMIEFHSMLGEYSKAKNRRELEKFEQANNNKIKFMMVINKLNEGVRVKGISGIIWFRPLDGNSKVLCSQQLGRTMSSKDPNKEISDNERPVVIDLVNNILRVNLDKDKKQISRTGDLDKLIMITDWIDKHSGIMPGINSNDRVESNFASSLKRIQKQYINYVNDSNELEKLKNKNEVIEILNLGNNIDLWNYEFSEKIKLQKEENDLLLPFEVKGILKDFIELKQDIDELIVPLSFEEKLKEIYDLADGKIENIPKYDSQMKFSDSSGRIGYWISTNAEKIKDLAKAGNEYAKLIAKAKGWFNLSFEKKLKEIYEIANGKIENIPKHYSLTKFSDNSWKIGSWISCNKNEIQQYAKAGNECAILIARAKGWFSFSFEEKLKEIYEIAEGKIENIPKYESEIKFSDNSGKIGYWISTNAEKIKDLSKEGNEYAMLIAKAKGWFSFSFEEKLKEIYEIANGKIENLPRYDSQMKFSDSSARIGNWISTNAEKIKDLAKAGNEYAILISRAKGWINLGFDEKLKEIYDLADGKAENIPGYDSLTKFSDNSWKIGGWISRYKNEIIQSSKEENEYAKFIAKAKGWLNLNFDEKLKEIYEIANGKIENFPRYDSQMKFSDSSGKIGYWISTNAEKIKDLAKEGNEYAILISRAKGWFNFSFEEKLKEIYDLADGKIENLPKQDSSIKFSDNSAKIGYWISTNAEKIKDLAKEGNECAILIARAKGWLNLNFDEKLKEIYEIANGKIENLPRYDSQMKFSDSSGKIGYWISTNAEKIKDLAKEGNEYALFIARAKGWFNLSLDEKLKEIYDLADGKIENLPKRDSLIKFSDSSGKIGYWISTNTEKIRDLAKEGNEYALFIARAKGWFNLSFEEKLKEIYELADGKIENIPKYDSQMKFSDSSARIGYWISTNAEKIKDLAKAGNEYAMLISKSKGWLKFEKTKTNFKEVSNFEKQKEIILKSNLRNKKEVIKK